MLCCGLLGGSWDIISKVTVISTLIGVISMVTLNITLVTKSHDRLSRDPGYRGSPSGLINFGLDFGLGRSDMRVLRSGSVLVNG